jgi:hypothetical protein
LALDQESIELFARSVRGVLIGPDDDATERLTEIGWRDILVTDARAAIPVVFRNQGEHRARSAALDDVAIETMRPGSADWLGEMGAAAFLHPRPGRAAAAHVDGPRLVFDGLALRDTSDGRLLTLAQTEGGIALVSFPAAAADRRAVGGIDASRGLARIAGTVSRDDTEVIDGGDVDAVGPACRRALAYELDGLVSTMLESAADYARDRVQFGQPIGAFQAVKHRLADVLVAVRAAEVVADESWDTETAIAAAAAKCLAGQAFQLAAENCLQVMGAIGFTWEHDLHRFIRRGMVIDVLYGSPRELRVELGRAMIERRQIPRLGWL